MDIVLDLMEKEGLCIDDAIMALKDMRRRVVENGEKKRVCAKCGNEI